MQVVSYIGRVIIKKINDIFKKVGGFSLFLFECIKSMFINKWYFKKIFEQFFEIGFNSLLLVAITAIFTGGVLALQTYAGAARFGVESTVPAVVILSLTRELGPILVGLMVAGKTSTSIAAELSTMKVSEQIDALCVLSTSPFSFLIMPRIIATTLSVPLLVFIADIIGVLGGVLASVFALKFNLYSYLMTTFDHLKSSDVMSGILKSFVFGFIISVAGCYFGYNARGGAEGVGKATIKAIVNASIFILLSNYFMTQIFFI